MDFFKTYNEKTPLHHAYVIEGARETILPKILDLLGRYKVEITGNPDVLIQEHVTFRIEDSRTLKESNTQKGIGAGKKIFVISAEQFAIEAQHALLKVLEEPSENTHFFFIIPKAEMLLPTVLSRMQVITESYAENKEKSKEAQLFIQSPIPERLSFISKLIEKNTDDEEAGVVKKEATDFINALELSLAGDLKSEKNKVEIANKLSEINKARSYIGDRGASVKMILEHLALLV